MGDHAVMMKRMIKVWEGEAAVEVTVVQKSQSVWRASGEYMEERVEATGRTANQVLGTWHTIAHRKGE